MYRINSHVQVNALFERYVYIILWLVDVIETWSNNDNKSGLIIALLCEHLLCEHLLCELC